MTRLTLGRTYKSNGQTIIPNRMQVRKFKTSQHMDEFLNNENNNEWYLLDQNYSSGRYVISGNTSINMIKVSKFDACELAHI